MLFLKDVKHIILAILVSSFAVFIGLSSAEIYYKKTAVQLLTTTYNLPLSHKTNIYNKPSSYNGLVAVADVDASFVIDLHYAKDTNFTGKKIYPSETCLLQKDTLRKLINANNEFKQYGYRLKIWDAYRPYDVQKHLWSIVSDSRFIANPYYHGSRHNRGAAVDITLVDGQGHELEMPTGFDNFTTASYRNSTSMSSTAKKNMDLLTSVMVKHGFKTIETEWWHFDDSNADSYPLLNVQFEDIK